MIEWKNINDEKPVPEKACLTRMKHGLISGFYREETREFHGYYWGDMQWCAKEWVYVEDL